MSASEFWAEQETLRAGGCMVISAARPHPHPPTPTPYPSPPPPPHPPHPVHPPPPDPNALALLMADHTSLDWRPLLPRITLPCLNLVSRGCAAAAEAVAVQLGRVELPCPASQRRASLRLPARRSRAARSGGCCYFTDWTCNTGVRHTSILAPTVASQVGRQSAVFPWYGCEVVGKLIPNCHTVRGAAICVSVSGCVSVCEQAHTFVCLCGGCGFAVSRGAILLFSHQSHQASMPCAPPSRLPPSPHPTPPHSPLPRACPCAGLFRARQPLALPGTAQGVLLPAGRLCAARIRQGLSGAARGLRGGAVPRSGALRTGRCHPQPAVLTCLLGHPACFLQRKLMCKSVTSLA